MMRRRTAPSVPPGSQHRAPLVNAIIDYIEIVVSWEHVLVNKVHTPFLRGGAFSIAVFNEA